MFSWEANPNERSSSVWVDRSKEYGTSSDPWSNIHSTDEGIVQSMNIQGGTMGRLPPSFPSSRLQRILLQQP